MSQEGVEFFFGRVLTDRSFRKRAEVSLEHACFQAGIPLSSEEQKIIGDLDLSLFSLLAEFIDGSLRRT